MEVQKQQAILPAPAPLRASFSSLLSPSP